jgi:hypothetical protein
MLYPTIESDFEVVWIVVEQILPAKFGIFTYDQFQTNPPPYPSQKSGPLAGIVETVESTRGVRPRHLAIDKCVCDKPWILNSHNLNWVKVRIGSDGNTFEE